MTALLRRPHTVITPGRGWGADELAEVWRFRSLFFRFAARDITLRYRQTLLGVVWVVAQPLLAAGVFALVFGKVAGLPSGNVPYVVFSYAGLLCWTFFSGTVAKASGSLLGNAALVSKVYFPRLLIPLSTLASGLIDFGVSLALMVVLLVIYGVDPGLAVLALPGWLLLTVLMASGIGLLLSGLVVRYRDVSYVLPVVIQFLLYASPVAYALGTVPHSVRIYFLINPLTGLLEAFRWSLLGNGVPLRLGELVYSSVAAVALFGLGLYVFTRIERTFADVI